MYHSIYPASLYLSESVPKAPTREHFSAPPEPSQKIEPHPKLWLGYFWNTVHVFAATYDPDREKSKQSYSCFYQSMTKILPSVEIRKIMSDFIEMNKETQNILLQNKGLSSFFNVYSDIHTSLLNDPKNFFINSLNSSDSLFNWTYLLHCYYDIYTKQPLTSYNNMRARYERSGIGKETWGNPIWGLIHTCALYSPQILGKECSTCYKAFISCLRFALPCPKCRQHLEENLGLINIDNYLYTKDSLFEYSVKLHNMVNEQIGKPTIPLEEARKIYDPFHQPLMQHNTNSFQFSY